MYKDDNNITQPLLKNDKNVASNIIKDAMKTVEAARRELKAWEAALAINQKHLPDVCAAVSKNDKILVLKMQSTGWNLLSLCEDFDSSFTYLSALTGHEEITLKVIEAKKVLDKSIQELESLSVCK